MKGICEKKINPKITLFIYNTLRNLGLYSNTKGTTIINKAVQLVILNDDEFFSMEDIYESLTNYYKDMTITQIRDSIKYALKHRNEIKCKNIEIHLGNKKSRQYKENRKKSYNSAYSKLYCQSQF